MSSKAYREYIRAGRPLNNQTIPHHRWKDVSVALRVDKAQRERWNAAADREKLTLKQWAINHLDSAAIDRTEELMLEAQRKYRTAGHPKLCGCADCARQR